ncbi:hypothetical protein [Mesomycoplasma ovipneumoniae]
MIRKTNEARNNNPNIPIIVFFNLPIGVVESNPIVCSSPTPLILVKIIYITKIIVLKIDNKKTNINFVELS